MRTALTPSRRGSCRFASTFLSTPYILHTYRVGVASELPQGLNTQGASQMAGTAYIHISEMSQDILALVMEGGQAKPNRYETVAEWQRSQFNGGGSLRHA